LAPNPNPCQPKGFYWGNALPTSFETWAQLAASFVAHVDQKFPGLVRYFEIWNEPDLQGCMCNLSDTTVNTRLQIYAQLYAVTAAAMKAQAQSDGIAIKVGGPGMSNGWVTTVLLPEFLGNPAVAPKVDFVSYHYYPSPTPYSTWEDSTSGLLAKITHPDSGFAGFYSTISEQTARGLQPNAASTPVIITEYNDNPSYGVNCCRNSSRYSPLFNSIAVSELLNTVYSKTKRVPSTLSYYRALDNNSFCLLGTAGTNCLYKGGALSSFPQLQTFRMISSPKFLALSSDSYMVPSAVAIAGSGPIRASAFFNSEGDSLLLINPTDSPQTGIGVSFANAGLSAANATVFVLNEQNSDILQKQMQLSVDAAQDGYSGEVDIPAYSVVGIRLK
jgi:hypothetical protein